MRPVTAEQTHRKKLSREQEPGGTGGAFRVTWVLCKLCQVEKGWEGMGGGKMCWRRGFRDHRMKGRAGENSQVAAKLRGLGLEWEPQSF